MRKVFDERAVSSLRGTFAACLNVKQKGEAGRLVDCITRHRHGMIMAFDDWRKRHQFVVRWATVRGKKYYSLIWFDRRFPLPNSSRFEIIIPGDPEWKKWWREKIFAGLAPEIIERHRRMLPKHLVARYGLDLRLREGKDRWGEPISMDGMRLTDHNERLQAIVVGNDAEEVRYLITRAGTFDAGFNSDVLSALKFATGLTGRQVRSADSLVKEIERQLELREEAKKIKPIVPRGRIIEVDPAYGVIIDDIFYPADTPWKKIRLPARLRSIPRFLFALYGRDIPEKPDIAADLKAPPWTIRRFGRPLTLYLLDDVPDLNLYVYVNRGGRLYLGYGGRSIEITGRVEKPDVASAFRVVFGVELPPQATREDVEAIVAMTALGGR